MFRRFDRVEKEPLEDAGGDGLLDGASEGRVAACGEGELFAQFAQVDGRASEQDLGAATSSKEAKISEVNQSRN